MAVIEKEVKLAGSRGEKKVTAIFDSGATDSCIQPELARELEIVLPLPEPMDFGTAKEGESLRAKEAIRLNFYLNGYRFSDEFMLIPGLSEPVIIGAKTLQAWRLKLNFETDEVIIDPRVTKLRLLPIIYQIVSKGGDAYGKIPKDLSLRVKALSPSLPVILRKRSDRRISLRVNSAKGQRGNPRGESKALCQEIG